MVPKQVTSGPLCFATFHADVSDRGLSGGSHMPQTSENMQHVRNIGLLFKSAMMFHPRSELHVLTSPQTKLNSLTMNYKRWDYEVDAGALMLSRAFAQQKMLRDNDFDLPIVLADSDILINGNLGPVFEEEFDVALTWRPSINMPINGGFLILNNRNPEAVRSFFDHFIAVYRSKYQDSASWYGDQLALRDICGVTYREMRDRKIMNIGGRKILFLPCETYNHTPADNFSSVLNPISEPLVLHFKGRRKRLMQAYWMAHLQAREHNTMIRRVAARLTKTYLAWKADRELPSSGNQDD